MTKPLGVLDRSTAPEAASRLACAGLHEIFKGKETESAQHTGVEGGRGGEEGGRHQSRRPALGVSRPTGNYSSLGPDKKQHIQPEKWRFSPKLSSSRILRPTALMTTMTNARSTDASSGRGRGGCTGVHGQGEDLSHRVTGEPACPPGPHSTPSLCLLHTLPPPTPAAVVPDQTRSLGCCSLPRWTAVRLILRCQWPPVVPISPGGCSSPTQPLGR